jgi:hypothetical protein
MGNGIRIKSQKHTIRDHPGLVWQDAKMNVYGFEDVNQMALDDRYGKVGAPLSKRRNGTGPAGRDAPPGLFGGGFPEIFYDREYLIGFGVGFAVAFAYMKYRN